MINAVHRNLGTGLVSSPFEPGYISSFTTVNQMSVRLMPMAPL